jgi:hypothetical protein
MPDEQGPKPPGCDLRNRTQAPRLAPPSGSHPECALRRAKRRRLLFLGAALSSASDGALIQHRFFPRAPDISPHSRISLPRPIPTMRAISLIELIYFWVRDSRRSQRRSPHERSDMRDQTARPPPDIASLIRATRYALKRCEEHLQNPGGARSGKVISRFGNESRFFRSPFVLFSAKRLI